MNAIQKLILSFIVAAAIPGAALDEEQTRALDAYLAQKGILNAAPAPVNVDLPGRARALELQFERVRSIVAGITGFTVESLAQLSKLELKLQKPVPIIYDDTAARNEIRHQAVHDCCAKRNPKAAD